MFWGIKGQISSIKVNSGEKTSERFVVFNSSDALVTHLMSSEMGACVWLC